MADEADADALRQVGEVAHVEGDRWAGAGPKCRVLICPRREPEGAVFAARTFDRLVGFQGIEPERIVVVLSAFDALAAGAREHFAVGFALEDFQRVAMTEVRDFAERCLARA